MCPVEQHHSSPLHFIQMAESSIPDHVIDIDRHGGTEVLAGPIPPPKIGGNCTLDENVVKGKSVIPLVECPFQFELLSSVVGFSMMDSTELMFLNSLRCLALPVPGSVVLAARNYGMSLWGRTAKISTELPDGKRKDYFLKVNHTCQV